MDKLKRKPIAPVDPLQVTESLGFQTFRRETRRPWSKEEDRELTSIVARLYASGSGHIAASGDDIKWDLVASHLATQRKGKDCRKRWCNSLDPRLRKGKWTAEEDRQLLAAFRQHGAQWKSVASHIAGRTDDQCAKRYIEVLDPQTKDRLKPWTHAEDLQLIRQVKCHGTKWKTIAAAIAGRPSLTCRNRWRKIVTDVARGKASEAVRREVEATGEAGAGGAGEALAPPGGEEDELGDELGDEMGDELRNEMGDVSGKAISPAAAAISSGGGGSSAPLHTEVEWKYSMEGPHRAHFEAPIASQELVHALVAHAKAHALNVTVHQHIHHHYLPPPPLYDARALAPFDFCEPEASLHRYQHFNYLPPLTEVPKLTSSAPSPEGRMHHFHHYSPKPRDSDLARLLNGKPEGGSPLASLAQVAAEDAARDGPPAKRAKVEEEEEEEGLDFWETMRNLTARQPPPATDARPVSQHHPLHHRGSSPGDDLDAYSVLADPTAPPNDQSTYDLISSGFGLIPFNPS
ncbi:Myb-like DNA-binding protein BAS1 [[Candida] zeylanoides]